MSIKATIDSSVIELKTLKINLMDPRTRSGREAETALNNYQIKVKPNGEHRFKTAKDAMICCLCPPPDDEFKSLHKLECVLGECTICPGFDRPPEEVAMKDDDELTRKYISFHWYDTLPSCSIHKMLPKYPPEEPGVRLIQTKSCPTCDLDQELDKKYVRGGFYKRKYLTKTQKPFQEFFHDFYLPTLKKYTYHHFLKSF
jgi:hypothetical protein